MKLLSFSTEDDYSAKNYLQTSPKNKTVPHSPSINRKPSKFATVALDNRTISPDEGSNGPPFSASFSISVLQTGGIKELFECDRMRSTLTSKVMYLCSKSLFLIGALPYLKQEFFLPFSVDSTHFLQIHLACATFFVQNQPTLHHHHLSLIGILDKRT